MYEVEAVDPVFRPRLVDILYLKAYSARWLLREPLSIDICAYKNATWRERY